MCEISRQIFKDGYTAGFKEGKAIGFKEGKAIGFKEGKAIGFKEGKALSCRDGKANGIIIGQITSYADMINKKIISLDQALSSLNMSIDDFIKYSNQYGIKIN